MTSKNGSDSSSLSRRTFLAASGTTVVATTAGCTELLNFIGDKLLEEVNVFNETDMRVAGSISVSGPAGDTALDESFDIASSESEASDDDQSVAVYDDVWDGSGSYEVAVELTDVEIDGESQASATVAIDNPDEQMLAVGLGTGETDAPIDFSVGESLSDFGR
ncbi:hypothetical protein [Halovivax asiaticus]|nr:hypothetical protein [Halovivax asiaticus]